MSGSSQDQLILMAQMTSDEDSSRASVAAQKYLPVALFLITSLAISVIGIMYTRSWELRLDQAVSGTLIGASESELLLRLDQLVTDAKIISGFIGASNFVSEDEFHSFSGSLLENNHTTRFCFLINYRGTSYVSSSGSLPIAIFNQIVSELDKRAGKLPEKMLVTVSEDHYLANINVVSANETEPGLVVTVSEISLLSETDSIFSESHFAYKDALGNEVVVGATQPAGAEYTTLSHGDLSVTLSIRQKVVDTDIFNTFRWVIVLVCGIASMIFIFQFVQARRSIRDFVDLTVERSKELSAINSDLVDEIMERARLQGELLNKNYELTDTNRQLEDARNQLIQREKMASLGQMSAGIAHEINNPVAFVKSNVSMMKKYWHRISTYLSVIDDIQLSLNDESLTQQVSRAKTESRLHAINENFPVILEESTEGLERVQQIVRDLRVFSRTEESDFQMASVNDCLDSALNILRSQIGPEISVHKHYGDIPEPEMMASQVNQVFVNLISNALHAVNDSGNLYITTESRNGLVIVTIQDDGDGIEADVVEKIFDPFFTTKEAGKGTGLGLSLSYGIVQRHGGKIIVESEKGQWTRFKVILPVIQQNSEQDHV